MQPQEQPSTVMQWVIRFAPMFQWPLLLAAFGLGMYVKGLHVRLNTAENNLRLLIERHMPQVHRALSEIRGKLETLQALMQKAR